MASFFDSGPLPDWKEIQKWLGQDMPWKLVEQWDRSNDSDWLNNYIKDIMNKRRSEPIAHDKGMIQTKTEKDAKYVTVNIQLSPDIDLRHLQLFATSDRLKLTGLPKGTLNMIRFPCQVNALTGKAVLKNDRLLIRFRRKPPDKSEYELFIRS